MKSGTMIKVLEFFEAYRNDSVLLTRSMAPKQ